MLVATLIGAAYTVVHPQDDVPRVIFWHRRVNTDRIVLTIKAHERARCIESDANYVDFTSVGECTAHAC